MVTASVTEEQSSSEADEVNSLEFAGQAALWPDVRSQVFDW